MIVNAHTHLGRDYVFEEDFTTERLLKGMEAGKVDASIVQPGTTFDLKIVREQHDFIAQLSEKMPKRIFGMANPSPHLSTEEYRRELKRCVGDLGFVAVKLHPLAHAVNPNTSVGRKVFQAALDLGIPVMVHTGAGVPWALPSAIIPVAKEFMNLKIVLAHCGSSIFSAEAGLAAQLCLNVYLETSWLPNSSIYSYCKSVGADRVMFGSDSGENVATELVKYRTMGLSEDELDWCLGKTAIKVFNLPI